MTHISTKPEPMSQLEKCPSWVKSTKSTSEGSLWGTDCFEASELFEQHVVLYNRQASFDFHHHVANSIMLILKIIKESSISY